MYYAITRNTSSKNFAQKIIKNDIKTDKEQDLYENNLK